METGTVTLKIKEHNQLIAFKKEVLKGNKIVVKNPNGLYRQGTIRYYTDDKIAKEIATESGELIKDLKATLSRITKEKAQAIIDIRSMSLIELLKWKY